MALDVNQAHSTAEFVEELQRIESQYGIQVETPISLWVSRGDDHSNMVTVDRTVTEDENYLTVAVP